MADERVFTLVGKFDDKITPSLTKLSKSLSGLTRDFEKMQGKLRPIARDMAIMAEGANRISEGFRNQRAATDNTVRGLTEYRKEMGKVVSAQEKLSRRVKMPVFDGGSGGGSRPRGGGRQRPEASDVGDGYTMEKGVLAGLATNMITGIFDQIKNAVGGAINYVKNGIQERIDDEMGDIQSAGGILSVGKEMKVPWADTYEETFKIQKRLNGEMANLAAALPGDTADYVSNMKQVTDTVMKVTVSNGPAMVTAMQKFNGSVKNSQDAYVEATKQLAKYTTLAGIGQTGGVPLTALAEQMLNSDKVNVKSLKTTFAALQKNPLVSGALEKYEGEMNKAGAGSAERYTAMLKAFEQAFPVEVLDAMTNSADGIIQGLKSGLLNPDTGLLGLGRAFEVDFAGLNRKMGTMKESLSVFDVFLGLFKAFGMVLGPIVSALPGIIEPFDSLMGPLKQFYVLAENTISNFKGATKEFANQKLDFAPFRGSLMAIGKLAKALGGDVGEYTKLEGMLTGKKLDLGAALKQAMKVLFSSEALSKFGRAIGEALGGFLSMLAGIAKGGDELVSSSGLASGFLEGWSKSGGTEAISEVVRMIVGFVVKSIVGLGWEAVTTDPIGTAFLAVAFVGPVRDFVLKWLGGIAGQIGTSLLGTSFVTNIGATIGGWAGAVIPTITSIWTAVSGFFTSILTALAPFLVPALIIVAVIAFLYLFRDQIVGVFKFLSDWVAANIKGPVGEVLQGVLQVWTAIVNMVHGVVDLVIGFLSGDQAKQEAAKAEIAAAFAMWWEGIKRIFANLGPAILAAPTVIANLTLRGLNALGHAIGNALIGLIPQVGGWAKSLLPPVLGGSTPTPAGKPLQAKIKWNGKDNGSMPLHSAVASEMANKPSGSDLVIANSSETIIPAAGGLGSMDGFVAAIYGAAQNTASVFSAGFQSFSQKVSAGQMATVAAINRGTQTSSTQNAAMLSRLSAQNSALMTKMTAVAAAAGNAGGGGGGGGSMALGGGYGGRGGAIAGALGDYIKSTGGAPGSIHEHPKHGGVRGRHAPGSYHYQGRAIDIGAYAYEQGGVLARVAQFNAKMGVKPVELLKAGDPGHSDHVHVAYGMGAGSPAFFNSANAADQWESKMAKGNPVVSSVRARSNEMQGGGAMTVNAPITINAQPGQDTDALASLVAIKLTQAVNALRYSSYQV